MTNIVNEMNCSVLPRTLSSLLLSAALGLGGASCIATADNDQGGEVESPDDSLDKSAQTTDHGALAPSFAYQVVANSKTVHSWTLSTEEPISAPLIVTRTDREARIAYVKIYRIAADGKKTEIYKELGAKDIVNEATPRNIALEPGDYEFQLVRYKAANATLVVSLGNAAEDGSANVLPDYYYDLLATPLIADLADEGYAGAGDDLPATIKGLRDETLALNQIEDLDPASFDVSAQSMRYFGFGLMAVFVSAEVEPETYVTGAALFTQDLGDIEDQGDDGEWTAIRIITDTDMMVAP